MVETVPMPHATEPSNVNMLTYLRKEYTFCWVFCFVEFDQQIGGRKVVTVLFVFHLMVVTNEELELKIYVYEGRQ